RGRRSALRRGARGLRPSLPRSVDRVRPHVERLMGRADLQLHSDLGDGLSSIEQILDSAERMSLDVIALTDHDDIRGAFALRDLAARRGSPVEIVTGIEVTTRSGHLLGCGVEDGAT